MNYKFVIGSQYFTVHKAYVVAVLAMLKHNNKIEAIRLLRMHSISGLREAKELAEFIGENFTFQESGAIVPVEFKRGVSFLGVES